MNVKKILASATVGAFILTATPIITNHFDFISTVSAKGVAGGKISFPKSSPAPKSPAQSNSKSSTNDSKSVSGGGKEYTPSKSAKDLPSNSPATKSSNVTNNSTGFGNTLRNIGLFAGGMMLGGLIGSMFGGFGFGGFLGDVLGLIFNVIMIYAAYRGIKFLYNKFRGNQSQNQNSFQSQTQSKFQNNYKPIDVTPPQAANYPNKSTIGMDYNPKTAADYYRKS